MLGEEKYNKDSYWIHRKPTTLYSLEVQLWVGFNVECVRSALRNSSKQKTLGKGKTL